jgi:hypothetical protein
MQTQASPTGRLLVDWYLRKWGVWVHGPDPGLNLPLNPEALALIELLENFAHKSDQVQLIPAETAVLGVVALC